MSQRFGGQFSPDGDGQPSRPVASPLEGRQPQKMRGRINLLYLAAAPLIFTTLFSDGPVQVASHIAALVAITTACWLTREGLEAEEAFEARKVAKRPAIPRKILGAGLMGLGVALATLDGSVFGALIYGGVAAGLHLGAFGLDPLRHKGLDGDDYQSDRVARAVEEAETHLADMKRAIEALGDRSLSARMERFQITVRKMFRSLEEDPRELSGARRYLSVYLQGARDASFKFADLYKARRDDSAKTDYTELLDDLEANFVAKSDKFLDGKSADLEIEISVLRERLGREGLRVK